ncbi:MAG TPA: DUF1501 domain-containing protein, partial [Bacteroidetes bacterium]|nr:DUF1501 domain-containing protein [Bacteroidota bacterium]
MCCGTRGGCGRRARGGDAGPRSTSVFRSRRSAARWRFGPAGLARPASVVSSRWKRREELLGVLRKGYVSRNREDRRIQDYDSTLQDSLELAGPKFMSTFDLAGESADLRESYGGEFGQRCLLARRLVERGVRFVEVSHNLNFLNGTGWDTHNQGQLNQHLLIKE